MCTCCDFIYQVKIVSYDAFFDFMGYLEVCGLISKY